VGHPARAWLAHGVLAVLEGVVRTGQGGLEIAQDGVDPGELRRVARLAPAYDDGQVGAVAVDHAGEASHHAETPSSIRLKQPSTIADMRSG